jgi:hypothetical protein
MKSVGLVTDRKEHLESKKKLNLVEWNEGVLVKK